MPVNLETKLVANPLMKLGFNIYRFATNFVSRLTGIKEIMVIAEKKI